MDDIQVHIGNGHNEHHEGHDDQHHEEQQGQHSEDHGEGHDSPEEPQNPESGVDGGSEPEKPEEAKPQLAPIVLSSGVIAYGKTTIIQCSDCGVERTIKPQDVFQVKRCTPCQKKYRNQQRAQYRKDKRLKDKEQEQQTAPTE